MNRKILSFTVSIIVFSILNAGCSGGLINIKVDSYKSDFNPKENNYVLLPGMSNINKNDLQFKEFSRYVVTILNNKGYKNVERIEDSQLVIFLSFLLLFL